MSEYYELARGKLTDKKGSYDKYAAAMKGAVSRKLLEFCRQDDEFAQAVAQGGSFEDCMKAVAKKVTGSSIEDLVAYQAAVEFYFPGAEIRCEMTIDLIGAADREEPAEKPAGAIVLNLADFL